MLKEVGFVPNLKHNLISLSELENKGYVFKSDEGVHGNDEECEKKWLVCLGWCYSIWISVYC